MATLYKDLTTPRVAPGNQYDAAAQQAKDVELLKGTPASTPVDRSVAVSALDLAKEEAAKADASRSVARSQAEAAAATQRQMRIDAINTTFAPRIAREKVEGDARLSRVAALNFNTGTLGSGVDTTRSGEQKNLNEKALRDIEDTAAIAINQAFTWADELADKKAEAIYQDSKASADAKVKVLTERTEKAMKTLDVFGSLNKTAEDVKAADPKAYETLRDVSGMSDAAISTYLKTKAPAGTYQWDQAKVSGNQMYVPKVVNGVVTMDTVTLPFTPKAEPASVTKTDTGVFILYKDRTYENIVIPGSGKNTEYTIPTPNRNNLLKQFTPAEVDQMQADIRTYGLDKVLEGIPVAQQEKVRKELDATYLYNAGAQ